jgi:hypothetical protein
MFKEIKLLKSKVTKWYILLKLFEHFKSNGISIKVFKFRLSIELNLNLMYFLFLKYSKTCWCQNIDQSALTMYNQLIFIFSVIVCYLLNILRK